MCPRIANATITVGSQMYGTVVIETLAGPSRKTRHGVGADSSAINIMLTSSSDPITFHARAMRTPAARRQQRAHDERRDAGDDVEVQAAVTHLHRHQSVLIRPVHQQLERQAEPLHADQDRQGQSRRQAPADRREAKPDGEHQQQHEDHHHRPRLSRNLSDGFVRREVSLRRHRRRCRQGEREDTGGQPARNAAVHGFRDQDACNAIIGSTAVAHRAGGGTL
jgi:hypothetical protein